MAGQKQEKTKKRKREEKEIEKNKKKSKKNKHAEEDREVEVTQEVTNGVEEELSNKEKKKKSLPLSLSLSRYKKNIFLRFIQKKKEEKKKKRKREEKEFEKKKKKLEQQKVVVTGKDVKEAKYAALKSFAESNLPENVLEYCCKNFQKPSPIQSHTWPFLLDGRDLFGIGKTGSDKTLAFGIPAIMHVLKNKNKKIGKGSKNVNPTCLVLSPTRELAVQISDVLSEAGKPCGLKSICVYGGSSRRPQINAIRSGVDIVIGTPGRLRDLIKSNKLSLSDVSFVVLDDADRMLDIGFEQPVRFILSKTIKVCQMVMFSATWPMYVHKLAKEFMDPNPVKVVIGSVFLAAKHDVMQIIEVLDDIDRNQRLVALLEEYHTSQKNRVLVFALYKLEAVRLEHFLKQRGWEVVSIHKDKAKSERTRSLSLFKEGSRPVLVVTEVAARGLDIPDMEVVINYSFPLTIEDYVNRIRRTGRSGKNGVAHTLFTQQNKGLAGELVNVLREAGQVVPADLLKFGTHVKKKESIRRSSRSSAHLRGLCRIRYGRSFSLVSRSLRRRLQKL